MDHISHVLEQYEDLNCSDLKLTKNIELLQSFNPPLLNPIKSKTRLNGRIYGLNSISRTSMGPPCCASTVGVLMRLSSLRYTPAFGHIFELAENKLLVFYHLLGTITKKLAKISKSKCMKPSGNVVISSQIIVSVSFTAWLGNFKDWQLKYDHLVVSLLYSGVVWLPSSHPTGHKSRPMVMGLDTHQQWPPVWWWCAHFISDAKLATFLAVFYSTIFVETCCIMFSPPDM